MRELTIDEIEAVNGGLTLEEGGLALMGVGIAGAATGVGVLAFFIGATMVAGSAIGKYTYGKGS